MPRAGHALRFLLQVREDVHACAVEVAEPRKAPAPFLRLMKSIAAARNSSSTVSMRLVSSGPVFSMTCLPTLPNAGSTVGSSSLLAVHFSTPRGPKRALKSWILRIVGIFRLLFGVEVIEVAEELVEAMHCRQMLVAVAEVVLAELSGGVAEGFHHVGDRRIERPQPELRLPRSRPILSGPCGSATGR